MGTQTKLKEAEVFNKEVYFAFKRGQRWRAVISLVLGGIIFLDSGSPIPIPLTGIPSILIGFSILAYGWFEWRAYQRLPLHEAIMLGREQGGQIRRTDLFLNLRLSSEKTDALLDKLVSEGFIERISEDLPLETEATYRLIS